MNYSKVLTQISKPLFIKESIFRSLVQNLLIVFNYHEISDSPSEFCKDFNLNVRPDVFSQQLSWIKKYFNVISPYDLLKGEVKLPAALITFDDGFQGAFTSGGKILKSYDIPAVVFMNMGPVNGGICSSALINYLLKYDNKFKKQIIKKYGNTLKSTLFLRCNESDILEYFNNNGHDIIPIVQEYHGKFATETDLLESVESGLYLGNHLYDHRNVVSISDQELKNQYIKNEKTLLKYKNYLPIFSYPFGQPRNCYNKHTTKMIMDLGAKIIFSAMSFSNINRSTGLIHRTAMFDYVNTELVFRAHCLMPSFMNQFIRRIDPSGH